jgi:ATP-binding cassette subfamily B protein
MAFVKPYKKTATWAGISLVVASANLLMLPVSARYMMDFGFVKDAQNSEFYFVLVAIVSTFSALSTSWRFYLVSWLGERVVADMRRQLFAKILSFDINQFETIKVGEVLSRLTTDTSLVQQMMGTSISMAVRNMIQLIGAFVMLLVTSVYLTAVFLFSVPLMFIPFYLVMKRQRRLSRIGQDKMALSSSYAGETLFAIHVTQAFTHEPYDQKLFSESVENAFKAQLKRIRMRSVLTVVVTVGITLGFLLVFWCGSSLVMHEPQLITQGQLVQFFAYAVMLSSALIALADVMGDVQRASGASERLFELLSMEPTIVTPEQPMVIEGRVRGDICYDAVSFSYPNRADRQVLSDVSIDIRSGQSVAFVGHSGAGKTTMLQLLLRFYEPQSGRIAIDQVPVSKLSLAQLRGSISFVPQEVVVFSGTVYENILYGLPEATREQVLAAGKLALVDEFVANLPEGYDTIVGERGMRLSGGQRQRLAIARAFLRDAPILLLDEATSNLDAENERLLQKALAELMRGRTTLVIAHRLSTVRQADQIIFMHHGQVLAKGKHEFLLKTCPEYAHLSSLQFIDD